MKRGIIQYSEDSIKGYQILKQYFFFKLWRMRLNKQQDCQKSIPKFEIKVKQLGSSPNMSIYYSGTFTRSAGLISAIGKQLKLVNLKPIKRIRVQFDPFHPTAITARDFLYHISAPKIQETNLNCSIKTSIVCDRTEPQIKIDLIESGSIKFLLNNLTVLEVLQKFNQHISSKVVVEEVNTATATVTKTKKVSVKKLNKNR